MTRPLSFGEGVMMGLVDLFGPLVPEASPEESEAHYRAVNMDVVDRMQSGTWGVLS